MNVRTFHDFVLTTEDSNELRLACYKGECDNAEVDTFPPSVEADQVVAQMVEHLEDGHDITVS